jgi:L-idonate 5-dehydrogenase
MRLRCMCLVIHAATDLRMEEQDAGEIGAGQVLVRVGMGGNCGSDLHCFHDGGFGTVRIQESMVLGHEVAGTVAAVAPDVTGVRIGDRVAVNPSRPCAACKYCLEGLPNQCLEMRFHGSAMRMPHVQGAFRNLLLCDASQCHPVAEGVPIVVAALAEPFSVGLHGVSRAGSLQGKRVLVSGCGPIGALALAAARARHRRGDRHRRRRRTARGGARAGRQRHDQRGNRARLGTALRGRQRHVRRDARVFWQSARAARWPGSDAAAQRGRATRPWAAT